MPDFRISKTAAHWLIQFATKIVSTGLGRNWSPTDPMAANQVIGDPFIDEMEGPLQDGHRQWINAMMILAKAIAGILAYQIDPPEVIPQLDDGWDFSIELTETFKDDID